MLKHVWLVITTYSAGHHMDNYKRSRAEINLAEGKFMAKGTNLNLFLGAVGIGIAIYLVLRGLAPVIDSVTNLLVHLK